MGHPHAGSSCDCQCHPLALQLLDSITLQTDTFALTIDCTECDCAGMFGVERGPAGQGPTEWDAPAAADPPARAPRGASFFRLP